ncbi:hypothetical protein [Sphingobacterium sp.]|uniref:hypothetical protein n=1 Tax=Sphingobacterium sp. TaxID=341027 RepID=UPI0031E0652B
MNKFFSMMFACLCIHTAVSCSPNKEVLQPEEPGNPSVPGTGGTDWSNVGIEYDDGTNIVFHVKIAIDKEGFDMRDMDFFKSKLKTQWDQINERFNGLDKTNKLKRNYIFVPDLEDIILYNHNDNAQDPSSSHWEVPDHHNNRIDRSKFQCLVVYDFAVQAGEKGGGFGDSDGVGNILVINPSESNIGKFYDHFAESANTVAAITHEMGHFRGVVDTYLCRVSAGNNPVSGQAFEPEAGNMNNPYPALPDCAWSDYEMRVINANGAKKEFRMIYKTMRDYFPDEVEFNVTQGGTKVENCKLNFYKIEGGKVKTPFVKTYDFTGGTLRKGGHELFWYNDWVQWPWTYYDIMLVEAINTQTGAKGYSFLPAYEVHNKGIKDKVEDKISGKSIFSRTIDIKNP